MDSIRRTILTTGAAATAVAAAPRLFAQQAGQEGAPRFYEKGAVRIRFQEAGSGFPLMLIPGGGLNSTIAGMIRGSPFNPIEEFKAEYRCVVADLRNSIDGQSSGPLETDRPWLRDRQVHGDGLLHRRSLHLEPAAAGAGSGCRRRAGATQRVASGNARLFL